MQATDNENHHSLESSSSTTAGTDMSASRASTITNDSTVVDSPSHSGFSDKSQKESFVTPSPTHTTTIPDVLPSLEEPRARTIVLCFDGTGDQFDSDNSNIVQLFSMLKKDDSDKQMCYYQAGIGTYTSPVLVTPFMSKVSKTLDEAIAWNLGSHVMDGYEYLMQNYKAGDKICIFGFSRGAYTARALAGMIYKVGLLPACNHQQVPFAYKMFTRTDPDGWKQSAAFKKTFSVHVEIEFLGVWDTVDSVGLIPRRLPFTKSNEIVRTFRHAIAIDERRAKFKVSHWEELNDIDVAEKKHACKDKPKAQAAPKNSKEKKLKDMERAFSHSGEGPARRSSTMKDKTCEEVWFAGCHCDVGGGSVDNDTPHSLARIPFRWMIREVFKTGAGILFYSEELKKAGLDLTTFYPTVKDRSPNLLPTTNCIIQELPLKEAAGAHLANFTHSGDNDHALLTEDQHDVLDAMSPVYDQLSIAPGWWALELFPMKQRLAKNIHDSGAADQDETWSAYFNKKVGLPNMGYGRVIPRQKKGVVKVHRTVKMRMDAQFESKSDEPTRKYTPKASFDRAKEFGKLVWVD